MTETSGFVVPQYMLDDWTPYGAKPSGEVDPSLVRRATLRERIADRFYTIRYSVGHWIAGPCDDCLDWEL